MALTASLDVGLYGNAGFEAYSARGYSLFFGRITGTYGGALTTMTISAIGNVMFVCIPMQSGYAFDYNTSTQILCMRAGSVSLTASYAIGYLASGSATIDFASFAMNWNGVATTGIAFVAFGL